MRQLLKASISFGLIGCLVLSPIAFVPATDLTVQAKSASTTVTAERVTTEYTKVYASRSKKAKVVLPLTFGTTVYQNATSGSWTKITYKGRTGWVPTSYLRAPYSSNRIARTVYGSHAYGVDTQAEFDAVYKRVKAEFDTKYDSAEFGFDSYMHRVLNGERGNRDSSDPEYRTSNNGGY